MANDEEQFDDLIENEFAEMEIHLIASAERTAITLEEYIKTSLLSGIDPSILEQELLADLQSGGRVFGEFRNAIRATAHGNMRRLSDLGNVMESGIERKRRWVTVIATPDRRCDSCIPRHGEVKTFAEWKEVGLPKSSRLICRQNCRCEIPVVETTEVEPIQRPRKKR